MRRKLTVLALGAFFVPAAILAGCGDSIPGNAVAEVDGTAIEKADYEHWLNVAAKAGGPDATVPDPPDFTECIAAAKKAAAKPAGGPAEADRRGLQEAVPAAVRPAARPGRWGC